MLDTSIAETQGPGALELDPFGYHPGMMSCIVGLGGDAPAYSPDYAFHTPYVEAAPGPAGFTVHFDGLAAKNGTLVLRVHMLSIEPGSRSRLVNSEWISLGRLIQEGGEISISFEGFHNVTFALVGLIAGNTDAGARGLRVTLDHPADHTAKPEIVAEAKSTQYGHTPWPRP